MDKTGIEILMNFYNDATSQKVGNNMLIQYYGQSISTKNDKREKIGARRIDSGFFGQKNKNLPVITSTAPTPIPFPNLKGFQEGGR